ncbi:MAG: hypothetical protein E7373_00670 [Clostridiales bacterium]|jgi:hypothetical protein|nr:hypothetical protein [Clostridiales bacterium]
MKEKTKNQKTISDFKQVLIKKALGYDVKEIVEEYVSDEDGTVKLSKKKVTKKNVPPDLTALKMLLESDKPISSMSDEELEKEKTRLLELLKQNS